MATIAEIIAARQAAKAAPPKPAPTAPTGAPTKPKATIAEKLETDAAMNRIDPPGKQRERAARKSAGLVITNKELPAGENRGQATEIRGPEPIARSLSETAGQGVPIVPVGADAVTATWHHALQALDTELCAMRDPRDPEAIWLALRHQDKPDLPPLLLHRLPLLLHRLPLLLWDHPQAERPQGQPF